MERENVPVFPRQRVPAIGCKRARREWDWFARELSGGNAGPVDGRYPIVEVRSPWGRMRVVPRKVCLSSCNGREVFSFPRAF